MFFKETLTDCLILFICRTECVSPIAAILAALNSACNKGGQRLNKCVTKRLASLAQVNHLNFCGVCDDFTVVKMFLHCI